MLRGLWVGGRAMQWWAVGEFGPAGSAVASGAGEVVVPVVMLDQRRAVVCSSVTFSSVQLFSFSSFLLPSYLLLPPATATAAAVTAAAPHYAPSQSIRPPRPAPPSFSADAARPIIPPPPIPLPARRPLPRPRPGPLHQMSPQFSPYPQGKAVAQQRPSRGRW